MIKNKLNYTCLYLIMLYICHNENVKIMKNYTIDIWYRYSIDGEQETDFERFEIIADTFAEACKIALSNFINVSNAIPFKLENIEL